MRLIRQHFAEDFTLGQLTIAGERFCTLEDRVREVAGRPVSEWKIPKMTAIPTGEYRVIITFSQRFQKHLPLLLDVPGFSGVRIHAGNFSTNTEGCVLLGLGKDEKRGMVTNSRKAMELFMPLLRKELDKGDVYLQIV